MICRHERFKPVNGAMQECEACGVWKGYREDPHNYNGEYYHAPVLMNFRNGIPRRTLAFNRRKEILGKLGYKIEPAKGRCGLEIGFGAGLLLWSFNLLGWDMYGIDSSSWAYTYMKETYGAKPKIFNANFEYMDKKLLKKETGAKHGFDLVYSCHVLEHLENPMKAIEECVELLDKGGCLYSEIPDKEHQLAMPHTHNWAFDEKCITKWYTQAGLTNIKTMVSECFNAPKNFPGNYIHIIGEKE